MSSSPRRSRSTGSPSAAPRSGRRSRSGDLETARRLLGRAITLSGTLVDGRLAFDLPMALPPDGTYAARNGATDATVELVDGHVHPRGLTPAGRVTLELLGG